MKGFKILPASAVPPDWRYISPKIRNAKMRLVLVASSTL